MFEVVSDQADVHATPAEEHALLVAPTLLAGPLGRPITAGVSIERRPSPCGRVELEHLQVGWRRLHSPVAQFVASEGLEQRGRPINALVETISGQNDIRRRKLG